MRQRVAGETAVCYDIFLGSIQDNFEACVGEGKPLFTTDASDLWQVFLETLPVNERGYHNCHACRKFVQRYGGLVTIDDRGYTTPVMWGSAPGMYEWPFDVVHRTVAKAKVTCVWLATEPVWGQPVTPTFKATTWQ